MELRSGTKVHLGRETLVAVSDCDGAWGKDRKDSALIPVIALPGSVI